MGDYPLANNACIFATATSAHLTEHFMAAKQNQQVVRLSGIVAGHLINGTVTFSPAPPPGIFAELAKFEAERILTDMVIEEIEAGRL